MTSTLRISRQQLAAFLKNDHDAIRQFETLFNRVANPDTTATAIEPEILVETAAHEALARIERLERAFQLLELAPAIELSNKENYLGNPSVDGYVLSSEIDGTRSWVGRSKKIKSYYESGYTSVSAMNGGTGTPTVSNTTLVLSKTITPSKIGNQLKIIAYIWGTRSTTGNMEIGVFAGDTLLRLWSQTIPQGYAGTVLCPLLWEPSSVDPITITIRARGNNGLVNVWQSFLEIEEIEG